MNRLTIKNGNYYCSPDSETSLKPLYDKFGKLGDLEEQLGCPLEIAFNLLNKEIVVFDRFIGKVLDIRKDGDILCIHYYDKTMGFDEIEPLSNYGKTFWLKKDKLE